MNAPATQSTKIDRAFAVQCLIHIVERTTKLLTASAQGRKWGQIAMVDVRALPEISKQFVEACGLRVGTPEPLIAQHIRQEVRQVRLLGELHATVSNLLMKCARESVAPETGDAFDTRHEILAVHELAVEFVTSFKS